MATAVPVKRMWTYADLEELPDDGHIYDILGGELVMRKAPDANHAVGADRAYWLPTTGQRGWLWSALYDAITMPVERIFADVRDEPDDS